MIPPVMIQRPNFGSRSFPRPKLTEGTGTFLVPLSGFQGNGLFVAYPVHLSDNFLAFW